MANHTFKYFLMAAFILFWGGFCTPAHAESTDEIKIDWATDGALMLSTGAVWNTFELLKHKLAPRQCIWCQGNVMDDTITDALTWSNPTYVETASDVIGFGAVPVLAFGALALSGGLEGRIENFGADALLIAQAIAISSLVNQITKFGVGRARPFTMRNNHHLYDDREDDNLSFYSGHTSMAFAFVVSAGMIAHIRNYDAEPYIWGFGIPLAFAVAYGRIAGQKHYFSDVLVGIIVGSVIGFGVPWLHKNTSKSRHLHDVNHSTNVLSFSGQF